MKYMLYMVLVICSMSCSKDSPTPFLPDLVLQDSIPARVFYFDLDYTCHSGGGNTIEKRSSFPTPFSKTSYSSFKATSESETDNGLRYVLCNVRQGLHAIEDSLAADGDPAWQDAFELSLKLNIATEGDIPFGSLFEKEQLLEFLTIGKTFRTHADSLGHIALLGKWEWFREEDPVTGIFNINHPEAPDLDIRNYTITVVDVEEYQDLSRTGEVLKDALKITVEVEGSVQITTSVDDPLYNFDEMNISSGKIVFLADYN